MHKMDMADRMLFNYPKLMEKITSEPKSLHVNSPPEPLPPQTCNTGPDDHIVILKAPDDMSVILNKNKEKNPSQSPSPLTMIEKGLFPDPLTPEEADSMRQHINILKDLANKKVKVRSN